MLIYFCNFGRDLHSEIKNNDALHKNDESKQIRSYFVIKTNATDGASTVVNIHHMMLLV